MSNENKPTRAVIFLREGKEEFGNRYNADNYADLHKATNQAKLDGWMSGKDSYEIVISVNHEVVTV